MSSVCREHAAEIDSKIGIIRRKVANFACGYTPETNSRVEPSKEYLSMANKELEEIESTTDCLGKQIGQCFWTPNALDTKRPLRPAKLAVLQAQNIRCQCLFILHWPVCFPRQSVESTCVEFTQTSAVLDGLIQEAGDMATKIFARLSETFADFGLDMPTYADEEIPVGIPLEKLVLQEEEEDEPDQTIIGTPSELATSDDSEASDVDFKPNIFITRPSDSGGPPSWTPMIKTKASRTVGISRLALE